MFKQEWESMSAREKNAVFMAVLITIAIANFAFAIELIKVMEFIGILDYVQEVTDTTMEQAGQLAGRVLTW